MSRAQRPSRRRLARAAATARCARRVAAATARLSAARAFVALPAPLFRPAARRYFVDAGAIACRRVKREDLRRIAKMTGGTLLTTLANMDGEESFDAAALGHAESVVEERVRAQARPWRSAAMLRGPALRLPRRPAAERAPVRPTACLPLLPVPLRSRMTTFW